MKYLHILYAPKFYSKIVLFYLIIIYQFHVNFHSFFKKILYKIMRDFLCFIINSEKFFSIDTIFADLKDNLSKEQRQRIDLASAPYYFTSINPQI